MADGIIRATRHTSEGVEFSFQRPSMPSSEDEVIDGNVPGDVVDSNTTQ